MEKYFSFSGRIRRTHYVLRILLGNTVPYLCGLAIAGIGSPNAVLLIVFFLILLVATWFNLAASVQRCHDMDKSGWYCIIPLYGPIIMFFVEGTSGINQYGADPKMAKYVAPQVTPPHRSVPPPKLAQAPERKKGRSLTGYPGGYSDKINKPEEGYEDITVINDYFGANDQQETANSQQAPPIVAPAPLSEVKNTSGTNHSGGYKKGSLYK